MSIKIHHGPPGSYKTSGAVADDFVAAVKEGRPVVTNVRGLDDADRVRQVLTAEGVHVPDAFELHHVDTSTADGRARLARWFHWAPLGAFLLIDEAQFVWPKNWTPTQLRELEFPGGIDAATAAGRPPDHFAAFDMHRHYNWDLVLTTPAIVKIRDEIRGASEGASKHKNQALIGIKGRYLEAFHSAEDSGGSASHFYMVRHRRIPAYVWKLYRSTTTGEVSDTRAGLALWKNPRLLVLLAVLVSVGLYVGTGSRPALFGGPGAAAPAGPVAPGPALSRDSGGRAATSDPASRPVGLRPVADRSGNRLFDREPVIVGSIEGAGRIWHLVQISAGDLDQVVLTPDLERLGYAVRSEGPCAAVISRGGVEVRAYCAAAPASESAGFSRALVTNRAEHLAPAKPAKPAPGARPAPGASGTGPLRPPPGFAARS